MLAVLPGVLPVTAHDDELGRDRERLAADAAILDQAVEVLERRFSESISQDQVTAGTAHAWVRYAAQVLRNEAGREAAALRGAGPRLEHLTWKAGP